MPRITEMFCFAIYDKNEEDEGVISLLSGGMALPLVGSDVDTAIGLASYAREIANLEGKQVRLYKFTHRETVMEINPEANTRTVLNKVGEL